jgi:hypothetical protein
MFENICQGATNPATSPHIYLADEVIRLYNYLIV